MAGLAEHWHDLIPGPSSEPRAWDQYELRHVGTLAQVHPSLPVALNLDVKTLHV